MGRKKMPGFLIVGLLVGNCLAAEEVELPNYKQWAITEEHRMCHMYKGKEEMLLDTHYEYADPDGIRYHTIGVFYDLGDQPWYLLYDITYGGRKASDLFIFEHEKLAEKWRFVADIAQWDLERLEDFMKKKYDLSSCSGSSKGASQSLKVPKIPELLIQAAEGQSPF